MIELEKKAFADGIDYSMSPVLYCDRTKIQK